MTVRDSDMSGPTATAAGATGRVEMRQLSWVALRSGAKINSVLKCSEQLTWAFCGEATQEDLRYLELEIATAHGDELQWIGAHFACLQNRTKAEIVLGSI